MNQHDGHDGGPPMTRREALAAAGTAAAALVLAACGKEAAHVGPTTAARGDAGTAARPARMPVEYVPHGGGPWPFVDLKMGVPGELERLAAYLRGLPTALPAAAKALLVISAHWEEAVPTVMTAARPPMLYDYYGFPQEAYRITWPAPGAPALAEQVRGLLTGAGFAPGVDATRGFDHGTFVPLKLAYPAADVPTVQLSLVRGLDPAAHLALGRALAPLRDEGVFIVGSGMSYHNMAGFRAAMTGTGGAAGGLGADFDAWLAETVTLPAPERDARLARWTSAPGARASHPREEHLVPLMVIAGAAGSDAGTVPYRDTVMGARVSAARFG